jgi:hypothetical protein
MIGDTQTEVAVREFLIRSQILAYQYDLILGYTADTPTIGPRSRVNRDLFGFPIRAEVPFTVVVDVDQSAFPREKTKEIRRKARADYIKAGAYASMILCRNYLSGLRDRNEYFEFLQKELGIAGGITNIALQLANANGTIRTSVTEGLLALNQGIDAYESFKFLSPEIETILPIVTNAQITIRDYYLTDGKSPTTFSGAMNAVSQIEYQCTRSGIRSILNKALIQGAPQFNVINGSLYATYPKVSEKPEEAPAQVGTATPKPATPKPATTTQSKTTPPPANPTGKQSH